MKFLLSQEQIKQIQEKVETFKKETGLEPNVLFSRKKIEVEYEDTPIPHLTSTAEVYNGMYIFNNFVCTEEFNCGYVLPTKTMQKALEFFKQ